MKKLIVSFLLMVSVFAFAETPDELFKQGVEFANQGHYHKAIECLKKALELSPGYAEYHLNLGVVYANNKDFDNAIKEVETSVGINPKNSMGHYVLAMLYEKKKETAKAIAEWEAVLKLDPADDLKATATKHSKRLKEGRPK